MKRVFGVMCVMAAVSIGLITLVGAQPAAQSPTFNYPTPGGSYPVGRTAYQWIDASRAETFTDDPDDQRQVSVTVWYPAAESDAPRAAWIAPELARGYQALTGIPLEAIVSLIQVNARQEAPLAQADAPFPVLILSHASGGLTELYTTVAESLASHGYIVFGVTHPYNAMAALLADGSVALAAPDADPMNLQLPPDATPVDAANAADERGARIIEVQAADLRFVLDQLTGLNETDARFSGHLDVEHVGVFGHSLGGASSLIALLADSRFTAAALMDSSLFADLPETIDRPVLGIFADETLAAATATEDALEAIGLSSEDAEFVRRVMGRAISVFTIAPDSHLIELAGAGHMSFSDVGVLLPVVTITESQLGEIDPALALEITNAYLLAFFDETLRGAPSRLGNLPAQYPTSTVQ